METLKTDIIIFGAGLTGLAIAHNLKKTGKNVLIIEQDSRPGGVINTFSEDGFIFEAGPNTGVFSSPALVTLFDDLKD